MTEVQLKTRRALRDHDEQLKAFRQSEARAGRPIVITCGKGCFNCCREPLQTSRREAELIFANIPEAEKEGVRQRTILWLDRIIPTGLAAEEEPSTFVWRVFNAWCPILKDGLCLTYDVRPMGCRSHMAVGPRINCDDDELRREQKFVNVPVIGAMTVLKLAKLEEDSIEMTHLPVWLAIFFGLLNEDEIAHNFYVRREDHI